MKNHKHTAAAESTGPLPYLGGVARDENRAAHGGVRFSEGCACGAHREVLCNGRHEEVGPWVPPVRRFVGRTGSGSGYYVFFSRAGEAVGASVAVQDGRVWREVQRIPLHQVPQEAMALLTR